MNYIKQIIKKTFSNLVYEASCIANDKQMFHIIANDMRNQCLRCLQSGITKELHAEKEIVVSLTTHSKRLFDVYLTIESIMQGTMKPNHIVLWLEKDLANTIIPLYLQKQMKRGLEIRYCNDIRSYKKLIPTLKQFPDSIIVTIDDDVIYLPDMLEKLVNAYNKSPYHIHANRVSKIELKPDGTPMKYSCWKVVSNVGHSNLFFFTGVGGVLYPPSCFNEEVFNEEVFMSLAPYGDDIWFFAMALLNGFTVNKVFTHDKVGNDFLINESVQDISLFHVNTEGEKQNDKQIKAVFDRYNIYKHLKA